MSSSSVINTTVNGSSRNAPKSTRGMAPPPAIFPNVITSPGSHPGNQPPVPHTIVQAFSKQRVAKDKAEVKAKAHADIRQRTSRHLPLVHVRMTSKLKLVRKKKRFRFAETYGSCKFIECQI